MKRMTQLLSKATVFSLILWAFASCKSDNGGTTPAPIAPDLDFYILSTGNQLSVFNAKNLATAKSTLAISNLTANDNIIAIDFRPATGQLYGLGSSSRLYAIDLASGRANPLGTTAFTPAISGTTVGFDFNPTVDRIRLVTSTGQNLRLHPELGTVAATDGVINGATTNITSAAYTENFSGSTTTILYDIDPTTDLLYKQDPPNNGTLVSVGALGVDFTGDGGFDIGPNNAGLAIYGMSGKPTLFNINLNTGKAESLGTVGTLTSAIGIAIVPVPVAYAVNDANMLMIFNPENPVPISKAITGLATGENVMGIDFRPATGQLLALGSNSRLYILNTASGAATVIGTAPFSTVLNGTSFGFDFNPTVDRIRVVSNAGQNLRLNPNDGTVAAVDGAINPTTAKISAAAYTSNFAGSMATILYDIDYVTGKLFKQDPPNTGTLVEVGSLGVVPTESNGFDIGGTSNKAWALLTVGGATKLYSVNLTSGAAMAVGTYTFTGNYRGFAVGLGF
jgi:Domain of unknown function (DUF4394)